MDSVINYLLATIRKFYSSSYLDYHRLVFNQDGFMNNIIIYGVQKEGEQSKNMTKITQKWLAQIENIHSFK